MKKNIIIIILSILVVSLSGYIGYNKFINLEESSTIIINNSQSIEDNLDNNNQTDISDNKEENNENNIQNDSNNNSNDETNNISLKTYENIITNDLAYLLGKKSLSELTNQDILRMLFEIYKNQYGFPSSFDKTELNNIHSNSVLRNIEIKHENFSDYSILYDYSSSPLFDYNNNVYTYANTGHSYESVKIINKELVEQSEKDNEITLSYKFVFLKQSEDMPTYLKLYYTINDIKNNNSFKEYSYYSINDEASHYITLENIKKYIKNNYDSIKNNLKTYNYTFKIENENIILKEFNVK